MTHIHISMILTQTLSSCFLYSTPIWHLFKDIWSPQIQHIHIQHIQLSSGSFLLPPPLPPVWGLGVDPSQQIDVLTELGLGESTTGVRQVPGLHNGTKAFLFQGKRRVLSPQCGFSSDNPGRSWPDPSS